MRYHWSVVLQFICESYLEGKSIMQPHNATRKKDRSCSNITFVVPSLREESVYQWKNPVHSLAPLPYMVMLWNLFTGF